MDSFIDQLRLDYPNFNFKAGKKFAFTPPKTIAYEAQAQKEGIPLPKFALLTLHELAHALLKHKHDNTHISRLKHEAEAWERAKSLSAHYKIPYDEDFAEDKLDTYRAHLHQKSLCPTCQTVRYESPDGAFHCPFCP